MSNVLSDENKQKIAEFIENYRFFLATLGGALLTIGLGIILRTWFVIFLAAIYAGLFYEKISKGILVGALSVLLGWIVFFLYYLIVVPPALSMADVFLSIAGASGLGFIIIILTIIIGMIGGAIGGYIGSAIHFFIPWPNWIKKPVV